MIADSPDRDDSNAPSSPAAAAPGAPNPYLAAPDHAEPSPSQAGVKELTTDACWHLMEASAVGRLALTAYDGRPDVFPVNFLVHDGNVYIRSAPGGKLRSLSQNPAVAFEVDGSDERSHWSVVVHADAIRLATDEEIHASGILELASWSPTDKQNFVKLSPLSITGRRFSRRKVDDHSAVAKHDTQTDETRHDYKPHPIPHFEPPQR